MAAAEANATHVVVVDWRVTPFRADRWFALWLPAAERALGFGATGWTITRSTEDPLLFRQTISWRDRTDFERYWASDEVNAVRHQISGLHGIPTLPVWHTLVAGETAGVAEEVLAAGSNGG